MATLLTEMFSTAFFVSGHKGRLTHKKCNSWKDQRQINDGRNHTSHAKVICEAYLYYATLFLLKKFVRLKIPANQDKESMDEVHTSWTTSFFLSI